MSFSRLWLAVFSIGAFQAMHAAASGEDEEAVPCHRFRTPAGKAACLKLREGYRSCVDYNARLANDYDCRKSIAWADADFEEKRAREPAPRQSKSSLATTDKEVVFRRVVSAMTVIKRALRDPESVVWEEAPARRDGTVVCIRYRARNGYGGYTREQVVFTEHGNYDTRAAWNRHCSGNDLADFLYAKHAVP